MKIRITKDGAWSFSPSTPIEYFKKGDICNLDDKKANRLIETNHAVKFEEEKAQPADENKMFTPENKEDKSAKPKPKKAAKKGK